MIELNLAPPELRRKKKKSLFQGKMIVPPEIIVGIGGGLVVLLVFVDLFLFMNRLVKVAEYKKAKAEYEKILPEKKKVDVVITEIRDLQAKLKAVEGITMDRGIAWAQKMNTISDQLPRGVWLRKMSFSKNVFYIEGSAISKQDNEMFNVHKFTSALKEDKSFLDHFKGMELGTIQTRQIEKMVVADFLMKMEMKVKKE